MGREDEPVRVKKMRRKIREKKEKKGIDFETDGSFVIDFVWSFTRQSDF
jgi:ferredoxin-thioredoxin reductase catalytic subunit